MLDISSFQNLTEDQLLATLIARSFDYTRNSRKCKAITDNDFINFAVERVMGEYCSGRDFLQYKNEIDGADIARATFFSALDSSRRLDLLEDISKAFNNEIDNYLKAFGTDYLRDFPEIANYHVYSGDGHYIDHASHTEKDGSGKNYAAGTLYIQDIRTGLISPLAIITDGNRKSHEIPIFRDAVDALPNSELKKTLWILDRAYVDKSWWPQKVKDGQHVIVRVKKNAVLTVCEDLAFDSSLEVNTGVTRVYTAKMGSNPDKEDSAHRIIEYTDPEKGRKYQFVCTVDHIEPGLAAWLYFLRWRIEKTFDNLKNDFFEQKAWATQQRALKVQSSVIAMVYNFMRLIKEYLHSEEGIVDEKVNKKYEKELEKREQKANKKGRFLHPFMRKITRMPKLSAQFIRTLKSHFQRNIRIRELIPKFRKSMLYYL
jgi:hypothetical protein